MVDTQDELKHEERVLPIKKKSLSFEAQDSLKEINLGTNDRPRTTKASGLLVEKDKNHIVKIITKYNDFFAWDYHEMLGLSRDLVEHEFSIREGFKPHR